MMIIKVVLSMVILLDVGLTHWGEITTISETPAPCPAMRGPLASL
jgi:hypothetical protein